MRYKWMLVMAFWTLILFVSACTGSGEQASPAEEKAETPAVRVGAGEGGSGDSVGQSAGEAIGREAGKENVPPSVRPEVRVTDTREDQHGGWIVDLPRQSENIYRVSSDNHVSITFSFREPMDEEDLQTHLVVKPEQATETEWVKMVNEYWFRVRLFPTEAGKTVRVGLTAGARTSDGTKSLDEDIWVTLERFPAPRLTMYLKNYPNLEMQDLGVYWSSPSEAKVVMEFTKAMDRNSLKQALARVVPPEEFSLTWLNDRKAVVAFNAPAGKERAYNLFLEQVKDRDGLVLSMSEPVELRIVPDAKLRVFNPETREQKEKKIALPGSYVGGVVSPDGTRAVCWEPSSFVGDGISYRYWLQDLLQGERVLLTEAVKTTVKWYPDGRRFQLGSITYSAVGEELGKLPVEELKSILGVDVANHGEMAYLYYRLEKGNRTVVNLVYQSGENWQVLEDFSYPLVTDSLFYLRMDPSFDPSGEKMAVVENPSVEGNLSSARASILDLRTGEKTVLAENSLSVSWSPRGDYLAVLKGRDGVEILTPGGEVVTRIQENYYREILDWSPDGSYLLLKGRKDSRWWAAGGILNIAAGRLSVVTGIPLGFDANGLVYLLGI